MPELFVFTILGEASLLLLLIAAIVLLWLRLPQGGKEPRRGVEDAPAAPRSGG